MRAEAQRAEFPYGWIQFCGPAAIEATSQLRMRKRLISPIPHDRTPFDGDGLDLANLGMVEITSEDEADPIECALQLGERRGWRAAEPGPKSSDFCSTSHKGSNVSGWFSRKPKTNAHKSSP
jgi:hypothetical protein